MYDSHNGLLDILIIENKQFQSIANIIRSKVHLLPPKEIFWPFSLIAPKDF